MTLQCPYCNWHIHAPVNDACPICQLPRPTPTHLASACAAIQRVLTRRHPEHHWIVEIKRDEPHHTSKTLTEQYPGKTPQPQGIKPMQNER